MSNDPTAQIEELRKDVVALRQSVEGLVEAWNTARGLVRFVKWLGAAATAATALGALVKLAWGR